jgi:hypothetical protein
MSPVRSLVLKRATVCVATVAASLCPVAAAGASGPPPVAPSSPQPQTASTAERAGIREQIRSARIDGEQLHVRLSCRVSGRLSVRSGDDRSAAVGATCLNGSASVTTRLPASALRHGHARKALSLRVTFRSGGRSSHMSLHLNQPRPTARTSATTWLNAGSYCYQRSASDGGGGLQSVSTTQANTFGLGYGQTLYTRGWIRPWTSARGTGAWAGSTVMWYTPLYGGWATGDGVYTYHADGTVSTTIGGTTADGNWFYLPFNGWNFTGFARGTWTQAGIEVWKAGWTTGQHLFNYVRPDGPAAYDDTWCRFL